MQSRDFVFWLQGFFELNSCGSKVSISDAQAEMIRRHLSLVFIHEIDPSIDGGKPEVAAIHQAVHDGKPPKTDGPNSALPFVPWPAEFPTPKPDFPGPPYRC
jgi:hypothetical protein